MIINIMPQATSEGQIYIPVSEFQDALHFAMSLASRLKNTEIQVMDDSKTRMYAKLYAWGI